MSELLTEILTPEEIQESFNEMEATLSTALSREAELVVEVERLRRELEFILEQAEARRDGISAPEDPMIKDLCERIGYGAVMDSAARQWQRKDNFGAHTVGSCVGVIRHALSTPTPPGLGAKMLEMVRAGLGGAQYMVEAGLDGTDFFRKDHPIKLIIDTAQAFTPEDLKALGVE